MEISDVLIGVVLIVLIGMVFGFGVVILGSYYTGVLRVKHGNWPGEIHNR